MTMSTMSSIALCPINFNAFEKVNKITNNLEATLLFSKLKFHQTNSKIKKSGKTWIIRSREQIASWFDYKEKKVDKLLSLLENIGFIEKKVGLWYGKKRLFISIIKEFNNIPVNLKLLNVLSDETGAIRNALIFSKIAFAFANSNITIENKKWCCLRKKELSDWSGLSIRTIDNIVEIFLKKGLLIKKKFNRNNKTQSHFHIPNFAIKILRKQFNMPLIKKKISNVDCLSKNCANSKNYHEQPAKKGVSIKIRSNLKKTNNNTEKKFSTTIRQCNINFDKIGKNLTTQQTKYLETIIAKTIERKKLKISNPDELKEQIKFSVLNKQQHKNILSFKHVVFRCMKILSDRNWKTPLGFEKYSEYGHKLQQQRNRYFENWEKIKQKAIKEAKQDLNSSCKPAITCKIDLKN